MIILKVAKYLKVNQYFRLDQCEQKVFIVLL